MVRCAIRRGGGTPCRCRWPERGPCGAARRQVPLRITAGHAWWQARHAVVAAPTRIPTQPSRPGQIRHRRVAPPTALTLHGIAARFVEPPPRASTRRPPPTRGCIRNPAPPTVLTLHGIAARFVGPPPRASTCRPPPPAAASTPRPHRRLSRCIALARDLSDRLGEHPSPAPHPRLHPQPGATDRSHVAWHCCAICRTAPPGEHPSPAPHPRLHPRPGHTGGSHVA
jgi:hypothetical protein